MDINKYFDILSNLHVDRSHGDPAPHKPILLLVILDMMEEGELSESVIYSPELVYRFENYAQVVTHRRSTKPRAIYPFFYTRTDGLWDVYDQMGNPATGYQSAYLIKIKPEFYELLKDLSFRLKAREILVTHYFHYEEQLILSEMMRLPELNLHQIEENIQSPEKAMKCKEKGRDAKFRIMVVTAYNFTCALTGYRLTTLTGSSIVDAAHIHSFRDSQNNDPTNGIALSKNAHWMFDHGLWSISDDYKIIISRNSFLEEIPEGITLKELSGRMIRLPKNEVFYPQPGYLEWHRIHIFMK